MWKIKVQFWAKFDDDQMAVWLMVENTPLFMINC